MAIKKCEIKEKLDAAKKTKAYMVAIWDSSNGKVNMYRTTLNFPIAQIPIALDMLNKNLNQDLNQMLEIKPLSK